MWKGVIRFEGVSVPVKLYSAVEDHTVRFRLLHGRDKTPIEGRMVAAETGEPVEYPEIRRGYEVENGVIVLFEKKELAALEPPSSRDIEIGSFVDPELIDDAWYSRPYFLGPDGSEEEYAALAAALAAEGREGIARWVMRKKSYVGALRSEGDHLLLITLRRAEEIVTINRGARPTQKAPTKAELMLARQLVDTLESDFDPAAYQDEYNDKVLELIEAKAKGKVVRLKKVVEKEESAAADLAGALRASLGGSAKTETRRRKKVG
jgi:DNA end-binding protein Ku